MLSGKNTYQQITESDFQEITKDIEKIFVEGSEYAMTLAEMFRREGRQEGRQEGWQEGREEGETMALVKATIKLLTKKFGIIPNDLKMRLQELDVASLEIIVEDILDMKSIDEINKYLKK
jgi:predicted transposase YdaD